MLLGRLRFANRLHRRTISYSITRSTASTRTGHAVAPPNVTNTPTATIQLGGSGRGHSLASGTPLPTGTGATSAFGALNPRQLSAHLDEFVVGQERAKKVLAVAVYNHYARLKQLPSATPTAGPPPPPPPVNDAYSSSFSAEDTPYPYPPHVARVQPRDRSKDPPPHLPPAKEPSASVSAPPVDLDRPPSTLFDRSYAAPAPGGRSRRSRQPVVEAEVIDPTNYTSPIHEVDPLRRKKSRTAMHPDFPAPASTPSLSDQDILTDFVGQVSGSELPPPTPPPRYFDPSAVAYEKSNVLLLGPTGSGKSLLARTLARCLDVPFVGVEATGLTMAGYVGEDVETCIHRLLVAAEWDTERASRGIVFIDEIDKLSRSSSASYSKDVSGEGVQQALLKILEGSVVSVPDPEAKAARRKGGSGTPQQVHLVDTTSILFILSGAFVGLEKLITKRIERGSIGFTARLPSSSSSSSATSSPATKAPTASAGPNTLNLVEPADLVQFGFIPEFIGRLPVVATLQTLTEADLLRVLTEPKNALVKQYEDLFRTSDVQLSFTTPALRAVAHQAVSKGTGARGLRGILEKILLEPMYTAPQSSIRYVLIDKSVAEGTQPAHYYSRGQKHIFENDFLAEEGEEGGVGEQGQEDGVAEHQQQVEKRRATA